MKKSLIALAIFAMAGSAMACEGDNCSPVVYGGGYVSGSNHVDSSSFANSSSKGNGTSYSYAVNITKSAALVDFQNSSTAKISKNCLTTIAGSQTLAGSVSTSSESLAYNVSTGTGSGSANAFGHAVADVSGNGGFIGYSGQGNISGFVGGEAHSKSKNSVFAGTNEGGHAFAASDAGFVVTSLASLDAQSPKGTCRKNDCFPATSDIKNASTSVETWSDSSKSKENGVTFSTAFDVPVALGNAVIKNATHSNADGYSNSAADGRVSAGSGD